MSDFTAIFPIEVSLRILAHLADVSTSSISQPEPAASIVNQSGKQSVVDPPENVSSQAGSESNVDEGTAPTFTFPFSRLGSSSSKTSAARSSNEDFHPRGVVALCTFQLASKRCWTLGNDNSLWKLICAKYWADKQFMPLNELHPYLDAEHYQLTPSEQRTSASRRAALNLDVPIRFQPASSIESDKRQLRNVFRALVNREDSDATFVEPRDDFTRAGSSSSPSTTTNERNSTEPEDTNLDHDEEIFMFDDEHSSDDDAPNEQDVEFVHRQKRHAKWLDIYHLKPRPLPLLDENAIFNGMSERHLRRRRRMWYREERGKRSSSQPAGTGSSLFQDTLSPIMQSLASAASSSSESDNAKHERPLSLPLPSKWKASYIASYLDSFRAVITHEEMELMEWQFLPRWEDRVGTVCTHQQGQIWHSDLWDEIMTYRFVGGMGRNGRGAPSGINARGSGVGSRVRVAIYPHLTVSRDRENGWAWVMTNRWVTIRTAGKGGHGFVPRGEYECRLHLTDDNEDTSE